MPKIDLGLVRGKQGNPGTNGADATINGFTAINIIAGKNVSIDQSVPGTLEISASFDTSGFIPTEEKGAVGGVATLGPDGKLPEDQKPEYTGSDISVSESDETKLDKALSNKLSITDHGRDNVSLLNTSLSDGVHICSNWDDCPPGLIDSQGTCVAITYLNYSDIEQYWGMRIYYPANNPEIYVNKCNVGEWGEWEKIATATPPQEYDLLLMDGWSASHSWDKNCYFKTQDGIVVINFSAENTGAAASETGGYIISYLPEGFRPSVTPISVCGDHNYSGNSIYQCWVHEDGALIVHTGGTVPLGASGTIVYRAT